MSYISEISEAGTSTVTIQQLIKSRGGFASHVTRQYNELNKSVSEGCTFDVAKGMFQKLCDAFEQFREAHDKCFQGETLLNSEQQMNLTESFDAMASMMAQAEATVTKLWHTKSGSLTGQKVEIEDSVKPDDSVSQVGTKCSSVSKISRVKAKAAAKRSALKAKLEYHKKQTELESKMLLQEQERKTELLRMQNMFEKQRKVEDQELKQLKLEADYKAAAAEEETLAKYFENSHVSSRFFKSDIIVENIKDKEHEESNVKTKC